MPEPFLPMRPPRFPHREIYVSDDTPEAVGVLLAWVHGRSFHPYAPDSVLRFSHAEREARPAEVKFESWLTYYGHLAWKVTYQREGDADGWGMNSGYSTCSDAARHALEMIEEEERAQFEATLVVGVA